MVGGRLSYCTQRWFIHDGTDNTVNADRLQYGIQPNRFRWPINHLYNLPSVSLPLIAFIFQSNYLFKQVNKKRRHYLQQI